MRRSANHNSGGLVRYAMFASDLADAPRKALAAATHSGVCSVRLGHSEQELVRGLAAEHPGAELRQDQQGLTQLTELLASIACGQGADLSITPKSAPEFGSQDPEFGNGSFGDDFEAGSRDAFRDINGSAPHHIPLDIVGTDFQLEVWGVVCDIPAGAVATYGEIARSIDRPRAARAVGNACGANPVALLIPCHRVVRGDNSIGGYGWDPAVKAALLAAEANLI